MTMSKIVNGLLVPLNSSELAALEVKEKDWTDLKPLRLAIEVRSKRDSIVSETDWMGLIDTPDMTDEWKAYRQALREITSQSGFPYSVKWPTKPE
tara:strand:+ start:133 stop:417 length:285 start_codon:yes stop_codon:yes gene_type:complete